MQQYTDISQVKVTDLLRGAPSYSVRQTIDVERLEDEIVVGPLPTTPPPPHSSEDPDAVGSSALSDYDTVSEQVDVEMTEDGTTAVMSANVRCERTVPIRGSDAMFKRSSVIVTKRVEVDLTVTPERRQLRELIVRRRGFSVAGRLGDGDTVQLSKIFKALAELNKMAR